MAINLWVDYYYLTETYDQSICSGRTDEGVAMPIGSYEYGLINHYASTLRKQLTNIAIEHGIDDETLQAGKKEVLRYSKHKIDEIYDHIHK